MGVQRIRAGENTVAVKARRFIKENKRTTKWIGNRWPWLFPLLIIASWAMGIPSSLAANRPPETINTSNTQPEVIIDTDSSEVQIVEETTSEVILVSLEDDCPLPVRIGVWEPKTQAKWYEVRQHCETMVHYSEMYEVDVYLVAAVMMQESGGWAGAESYAGAQGAMQVMPFHYCASWDPIENIDCGIKILSDNVGEDGKRAGLAAYNAGAYGRDQNGLGWDYADIVLAIYNTIIEAVN